MMRIEGIAAIVNDTTKRLLKRRQEVEAEIEKTRELLDELERVYSDINNALHQFWPMQVPDRLLEILGPEGIENLKKSFRALPTEETPSP